MDSNNNEYRPIGERVAILETQITSIHDELRAIRDQLDQLLDLKAKGMGAFGLVSLLVGSGLIGLVVMLFNIFSNKPHL